MAAKPTGQGYGPRRRMQDTYRTSVNQQTEKPNVVNTSMWIDRDLHRQLKIRAATEGVTLSALIERGIRLVLDSDLNTTE